MTVAVSDPKTNASERALPPAEIAATPALLLVAFRRSHSLTPGPISACSVPRYILVVWTRYSTSTCPRKIYRLRTE